MTVILSTGSGNDNTPPPQYIYKQSGPGGKLCFICVVSCDMMPVQRSMTLLLWLLLLLVQLSPSVSHPTAVSPATTSLTPSTEVTRASDPAAAEEPDDHSGDSGDSDDSDESDEPKSAKEFKKGSGSSKDPGSGAASGDLCPEKLPEPGCSPRYATPASGSLTVLLILCVMLAASVVMCLSCLYCLEWWCRSRATTSAIREQSARGYEMQPFDIRRRGCRVLPRMID